MYSHNIFFRCGGKVFHAEQMFSKTQVCLSEEKSAFTKRVRLLRLEVASFRCKGHKSGEEHLA